MQDNLTFRDAPLSGSQIQRGVFQNTGALAPAVVGHAISQYPLELSALKATSDTACHPTSVAGSKDVGRDPDWDPTTFSYRPRRPSNFHPSEEEVERFRQQKRHLDAQEKERM